MGEAITEPQLRSRDAIETEARTGLGAGGWRVGGAGRLRGAGVAPRHQTLLDTIQSERSSVAVSTFSSASKCQPVFARKHTQSVNAADFEKKKRSAGGRTRPKRPNLPGTQIR